MNNQEPFNGVNPTPNVPTPNYGTPNPQVVPQQPVYNTPVQPTIPVQNMNPQGSQPAVQNPIAAVSNLNKEEAMEEALSHTTQYSPFEAPVSEIKQEVKKNDNKKAFIFIGIIVLIMALFIFLLPQISKLFGW